MWVEALLPYDQYRGAGVATADCKASPVPAVCHWVPMDPSFKQYRQRSSGLDPYSAISFDYTAYYNAIKNNDAARRNKNPLEIYQEQVLGWLGTKYPGKTLEDIPDFVGIVPEAGGLIPASPPFTLLGTRRSYNSASDHDAVVGGTESKKWQRYVWLEVLMSMRNGSAVANVDPPACSSTKNGPTVSESGADFYGYSGKIPLSSAATQRFTFTLQPNSSGGFAMVARLDGTKLSGISIRLAGP